MIAAALRAGDVRAGVRADFEPPEAESWNRLGFISYKPTFVLKDIGRDSNVFYDPDVRDTRSDFTATVSPALDGVVSFGNRGFLTLHTQADYVWYQTFSNATHLNLDWGLRGNLNFRSLRLFVAGEYQRNEERPSNEVDQRARRTNHIQRAGVGYEVSPATAVDVIVSRESIDYADQDFGPFISCRLSDGTIVVECRQYRLGDFLSRTETSTTVRLTRRVFGRTRLVLDAEERRHDFQSDVPPPDANGNVPPVGSFHDARESRLLGGFEVERGGFLSGLLRFGISSLKPRVLPERKTHTAVGAATLNWRIGGRVALITAYDRDLNFSIYGSNLYFIQDHGDVECLFYLNRVLALDGGYGLYRLSYPRIGPEEPRRDEIRKLKGGIRFRLANRTVATLSVAGWTRTSNVPNADSHQVLVTTGVETTF